MPGVTAFTVFDLLRGNRNKKLKQKSFFNKNGFDLNQKHLLVFQTFPLIKKKKAEHKKPN